MKIAVRFCGGCNPSYDRRGALERIQKLLEKYHFEFAKEDESYDKLLVISGCMNQCATFEQFHYAGDVLRINNESEIEETIKNLEKLGM
ncbi:MAG: hypothetical protein ACRCUS_00365 [Anaerovoracaceae bacterium]